MKWFKRIGILILATLTILFFISNEPKPIGKTGVEADVLAHKMLSAINKSAWDSTRYVQWTFKGVHTFFWDKNRNFVQVNWGENQILLSTKTIGGNAYINGELQTGIEADKLIKDAWSYFCNDSFWLNAPSKVFDSGTERSIIKHDDGSLGLLITYASGGVTPGDSYLWILDENGLPKSWKMWVKIIPIGGLEFSWTDWKTLSTGAKVATFHKSKILDLDISKLKAGMNLENFDIDTDPFQVLE